MPQRCFKEAGQDQSVLQCLCLLLLKAKLQAIGTNELFLEDEYESVHVVVV